MPGFEAGPTAQAKHELRERLLEARRKRSLQDRTAVGESIAWHLLAEPVVARARRVAAYLSMAEEPGTGPLLDRLVTLGTQVLVPVVDGDRLDWVRHEPGTRPERGPLGVQEPTGTRLGTDALADVDVVVAPALAVDHAGHRLGRGAGYYDRALAEVAVPVIALVHADELLPRVPAEPHDVPVTMAATEAGIFRVP